VVEEGPSERSLVELAEAVVTLREDIVERGALVRQERRVRIGRIPGDAGNGGDVGADLS
jgi:hypothetical protein